MELYHPKGVLIKESVPSQYERWLYCLQMIQKVEATEKIKYSHVIMNRPDQVVLQDLPHVETFPNYSVWVKPYGELMKTYNSTWVVGDDTATQAWEPHPVLGPVLGKLALSDLFLIIPRAVADGFVQSLVNQEDCGTHKRKALCGETSGAQECLIRCALAANSIPFVFQNFQLRILREHHERVCPYFNVDIGKHYNSICL
jgi:hypothetical protein